MTSCTQSPDHAGSPAPRVSVCIPTYRGAATLGAAIGSVLAQTERDLELVVIDDNSPDETEAVAARYADDPRLRYVRNPRNLGPQGNWNRCFDEARGHYFKLLPHDDVIAPRCLERQAAVLDADPDERLALVFCARDVLSPDNRVLMRRGLPGGREGWVDAGRLLRSCVRRGTNLIGEPGAVLMRRSLAARVGPFDATYPYVIDLDYWSRLLGHGDAWYCDEALAGFRVSRTQWSVVIGSDQGRDFEGWVRRTGIALDMGFAERIASRITPRLNMLARLVFYQLYLR